VVNLARNRVVNISIIYNLNSGFHKLYRDLKTEKAKVDLLAPHKYLFATSLDLSVQNVQDILDLFSPFIKSLNDIYGKKPLNYLLGKFPSVIDRHFKLWYSSTDVLKKIIHFQLTGRSLEFTEDYLKKKLNLYVRTKAFDTTRDLLQKNKFVIITGDPGIGKTTLAELLIYEYIKEDFNLTYVYDDIRDIDKSLRNDDSKQIFYFDDFLGHNSVEIQKAKGSESILLMILKRLTRSKNKYLVFTTRSFIFKSATEISQKFKDFNIQKFESIVDLKSYQNNNVKLQILLNHAEYSDMDDGFKDVLNQKDIQRFIINHKSFSPRSIEYITTSHRLESIRPADYQNYIIRNFDYPDEIWREAYLDQIDDMQRMLINTMFSLGDSVQATHLEGAFDNRLAYESKHNNFTKPMFAYSITFKKLYGSFIIDDNKVKTGKYYRFNNPSLVDFLDKFIESNSDEVYRISISSKYVIQLSTRFYKLYGSNKRFNMPLDIRERLFKFDFQIENYKDYDSLIVAFLLLRYVKSSKAITLACSYLLNIEDYTYVCEDSFINSQFKLLFNEIKNKQVIATINTIGMKLFAPIIDDEFELEEIVKVCRLIEDKFSVDPKLLLVRELNNYRGQIEERFFQELDEELEELKNHIQSEDELDVVADKYSSIATGLEEFGIRVMNFGTYFNYMDWIEIIMTNQFRYARDNDRERGFD